MYHDGFVAKRFIHRAKRLADCGATIFTSRWKLQFTLRSLLLVTLLVGVAIWACPWVRRWRSAYLWHALEQAQLDRDVAQQEWKRAYQNSLIDVWFRSQEQCARQKYFAAHKRLASTLVDLKELYGVKEVQAVEIVHHRGENVLVPQ